MKVLTWWKIFLGKTYNAFNGSINVFRDHLIQNTVFKKFLRGRVKYKGRNFVFYSFCYRLTCSFTCCNLETSVLDSFCAKDSRNEDG